MDFFFFDFGGMFFRWLFKYKCTLDKKRLKELYHEKEKGNIWYSVSFYTVLLFLILGIQYLSK